MIKRQACQISKNRKPENLSSDPRGCAENYQFGFDAKWEEKLIDLMDRNSEIFKKIVDDPEFGGALKDLVMSKVYEQQRTNIKSTSD